VPKPLANANTNTPLVPTDVIDAPSQRLYVVAFYFALNAYRIYESWNASDELDSTWLFLKWVSLDGIFLFGLQALRIPWLEWAFPTTLAMFLLHVVGNVFLMFRIPVRFFVFCVLELMFFEDELPADLKLDSFGRVARRLGQGSL
jgi:nucleoporin POM152